LAKRIIIARLILEWEFFDKKARVREALKENGGELINPQPFEN
jgi:hypothetical protein